VTGLVTVLGSGAMTNTINGILDSDVMLVIGSSLTISPVCDLPIQARHAGASIIVVNFEPTPVDYLAEAVIHANVIDVIPRLVAPFLEQ